MFAITIFLLAVVGTLISANALLWLRERRTKEANPGFEATFQEIPKSANLQDNEIQTIYSRINALEEASIQTQNKLNEIKPLKGVKPHFPKKEISPKSNRLKILEEYLKKV